jgi:FkbM family methyltransferase
VKSPAAVPHRRVPRRSVLFGATGALLGGAAGFAAGYGLRAADDPRVGNPGPGPEGELEQARRSASQTSYAQFGEDLVMASLCHSINLPAPTYLDIGACDPILRNNTYLFYERGCRGVLVEPNVDLTGRLRQFRPRDTVLVAGIGIDDRAEADYYVMSHAELNTFDKDQVAHIERTSQFRLVRVVKMPLLGINRVIAEHFGGAAPDIVSIDIEGLDYAVLQTLDFARFRPKMICVETIIYATLRHNTDTPKLLAEKGYELRGMTYPNMVFLDKGLLAKS